ncbi:hypothetical protein [Cohnella sp. JJ-181]|uniref:hypothetical protein n=1 Tax=Cohnella rhizoplanae TaxID=2974897 RepID=UPI0022FFAAA6|nr:hypothetical protein [Cohnella sp. JJ-181]CAI6073545.1 hypothetical protein COHCIP112018_02390 [Cohnella sp. JJ-181]
MEQEKRKALLRLDLQLFAGDGEGEEHDDDGDGGQNQPGKTFTQEEVDRIVGERLARAKKPEDYDDLREIGEHLKEFGYSGTPAEVKAVLKQQAEEKRKAQELKDLEEEAEEKGASPELLADIKSLKDELKAIKKEKEDREQAAKDEKARQEAWNKQETEFKDKHPDVDLEKLGQNDRFVKFLSRANPTLSLLEVYEDFLDLVGGAEAAAIAKIKSNNDRSTASGKGGGGDHTGGTYGLNDHQVKLAKQNGMSVKEYAELLGQIKK